MFSAQTLINQAIKLVNPDMNRRDAEDLSKRIKGDAPEKAAQDITNFAISTNPAEMAYIYTAKKVCKGIPKDTCSRAAETMGEAKVAIAVYGTFASVAGSVFSEEHSKAGVGGSVVVWGLLDGLFGLGGEARTSEELIKNHFTNYGTAIIKPGLPKPEIISTTWADDTVYVVVGIRKQADPEGDAKLVMKTIINEEVKKKEKFDELGTEDIAEMKRLEELLQQAFIKNNSLMSVEEVIKEVGLECDPDDKEKGEKMAKKSLNSIKIDSDLPKITVGGTEYVPSHLRRKTASVCRQ